MLYTFGKIFFPRLIHQEKKLRARMRVVALISGAVLIIGVVMVINYAYHSRMRLHQPTKSFKARVVEPPH